MESPKRAKIETLPGYRYCPHCDRFVASRTYRAHVRVNEDDSKVSWRQYLSLAQIDFSDIPWRRTFDNHAGNSGTIPEASMDVDPCGQDVQGHENSDEDEGNFPYN